jgi:hypothetical protein
MSERVGRQRMKMDVRISVGRVLIRGWGVGPMDEWEARDARPTMLELVMLGVSGVWWGGSSVV